MFPQTHLSKLRVDCTIHDYVKCLRKLHTCILSRLICTNHRVCYCYWAHKHSSSAQLPCVLLSKIYFEHPGDLGWIILILLVINYGQYHGSGALAPCVASLSTSHWRCVGWRTIITLRFVICLMHRDSMKCWHPVTLLLDIALFLGWKSRETY